MAGGAGAARARLDRLGRRNAGGALRAAGDEELLRQLAAVLSPSNHAQAVRVAELPDRVRGDEDVKLRNAEAYAREVERETAALGLRLPLANW